VFIFLCLYSVNVFVCVCVYSHVPSQWEYIYILTSLQREYSPWHLYIVRIPGRWLFFFLTHTVQRSCFTALAYFGVEYSHAVPLHCEDTRALTFFFRCVFFFGSQRLMPPWSSFLRITLTTPPKVWFCYTTLLHYFTTLLYYTTLLHYFTTLLYYTTLLHYFTTLLYYTTLLHYFTTLLYYTTLLDHSYHTPESGGAWTRKSWCRGYN